jgi:hypothetical protein
MKHRSWRKTSFQPTSLIAAVLLLLFVFVSISYFYFLADPRLSVQQEAMLAELQLRRGQWEEKRPPAFSYVVERECECPLNYTEPFKVVEYLDEPDNHSWIDDYFLSLEKAIQSGDVIDIRYDPRYRYPNDFAVADEQTFVRDFEVLRYSDD